MLAGAVLTAHWTALWMIADQRGLALPDDVVSTGYLQVLRTTLLAAFAGLGGYALTMLFRSTVATLGVLFAVSVAAPLLLAVLNFEGNQRLMPQHNFTALALDGVTLVDYSSPDCADGYTEQSTCEIRLTKSDATAYFGVLLLLAGGPSLVSFRRRDVP